MLSVSQEMEPSTCACDQGSRTKTGEDWNIPFCIARQETRRTLNSKVWERVCADTIGGRGWLEAAYAKGENAVTELNRIRKGAASRTEEMMDQGVYPQIKKAKRMMPFVISLGRWQRRMNP